jgi:hypothetical protein
MCLTVLFACCSVVFPRYMGVALARGGLKAELVAISVRVAMTRIWDELNNVTVLPRA